MASLPIDPRVREYRCESLPLSWSVSRGPMTEALLKRTESDHYPVHVTAALPTLGDSVTSYSAYHHVGMQPGTHLGLPSPSITVVLGIGAPTHIVATPGGDQVPSLFMAMVGGFHMGPVVIGYDNEMCGIQL